MADYFEHIQWQVSFADVHPTGQDGLGETLPIKTSQFEAGELETALKALAIEKAAGCDDIPPEFWKVLLGSATAMDELLRLCQACWSKKRASPTNGDPPLSFCCIRKATRAYLRTTGRYLCCPSGTKFWP